MARNDWFEHDSMSRERDRGADRGAFFRDRDDREMMRRHDRGRGAYDDWSATERGSGGQYSERHFGPDDYSRGIPTDETSRLIASNKVEGTLVYDRRGDRIGTIHNFMVDKLSGQVVYAVLRHSSGFLGLGERYYPLDWDELDYDTEKDGYRIGKVEEDLREMSSFDSEGRRSDRSFGRRGGGGRGRGFGRGGHGRRDEFAYDRDRDRGTRW